jgi:hypothetical protein
VASLISPWFSVVSGGLACLVGVIALARLYPELWNYHGERFAGGRAGKDIAKSG